MPAKNKNIAREWFNTIFYGGLIAIIFRSLLIEPFNIPSGSMIPTLHIGDHIFVTKWSYGYSRYSFPFGSWKMWDGRFLASEPEVGDVVVFRNPTNEVQDYVKRLIGVPGDRIQMINGRLHINGAQVERKNPRPYVWAVLPKAAKRGEYKNGTFEIAKDKIYIGNKPAEFNYTIQYEDDCTNNTKYVQNYYMGDDAEYLPQSEPAWEKHKIVAYPSQSLCGIFIVTEYTEVLPNGVEHNIVEFSDEDTMSDFTREYLVPDEHYFFMGDDRDRSADSRFALGMVPREYLMGRVQNIWYSHNYYAPLWAFWSWGNKIRWDRFGLGID